MVPVEQAPAQRGFTLLEVLVAFVVLALVLGVLLNLGSVALDTTSRASERQQALMLAQSRLAEVLARPELMPGTRSGGFDDAGYRWELSVSPFQLAPQDGLFEPRGAVPYAIELSVTWPPRQRLTLTTLRLVREP